jgi:hypothetical protein
MTPDWSVLMVTLSESFRTTLDGIVRELGALPVPWTPAEGGAPNVAAGSVWALVVMAFLALITEL